MTASLSPGNEVPAIANAENTGHGAVQITLNVTRDGTGAITGGTADFHFQLSGFPSSTTIVAAHIHPGAAGVNGGVIVNTGVVAASPVTQADGVMSFTASGITVSAATLQQHREQSGRLLLQCALADEPGRSRTRTAEPGALAALNLTPQAGSCFLDPAFPAGPGTGPALRRNRDLKRRCVSAADTPSRRHDLGRETVRENSIRQVRHRIGAARRVHAARVHRVVDRFGKRDLCRPSPTARPSSLRRECAWLDPDTSRDRSS